MRLGDFVELALRLSPRRAAKLLGFVLVLALAFVPPLREQLTSWYVEWKSGQYLSPIEPLVSPSPILGRP